MLTIVIHLTVKSPADIPHVRDLLTRHGRLSRAEPGCLRFDAYQSQKTPESFTLVEHWESAAALDQHRLAEGYLTIYQPQVLPLVDRVPHPSDMLT